MYDVGVSTIIFVLLFHTRYCSAIVIFHEMAYRDYLFMILVMPKWSKVVMKLFIFQGSLIKFLFHEKADQIIYLQKHPPPDRLVAPLFQFILYYLF